MEGIKQDVEYWISQFNNLRKTIKIDKWSYGNHVEYMDLYIYKGDKFYSNGFLDFKIFQKKSIGICIFLKKAAICHIQLKIMC